MEITDLLKKLKDLQLEQDKIIAEITSKAASRTKQPNPSKEDSTKIRVGDHIKLLTGGLKCKRGDIAEVTSVSPSSISFIVLRNSHQTYRKPKNVSKVAKQSEQK
jgi:hypothetical protein